MSLLKEQNNDLNIEKSKPVEKEPTWGYKIGSDQYTSENGTCYPGAGQLVWLENKKNKSEYEEALLKKLKEIRDEKAE